MKEYKIINLKGKKYTDGKGSYCELKGGFGLEVIGMGLVSFAGSNTQNGIKTPYNNKKKIIQSIIDAGGLTDFSNIEFIN